MNGTVKSLCNYTRNLQENLDFMLGQLQKEHDRYTDQCGGAEQQGLQPANHPLRVQQSVSTLGSEYNKLAARVTALEQKTN